MRRRFLNAAAVDAINNSRDRRGLRLVPPGTRLRRGSNAGSLLY